MKQRPILFNGDMVRAILDGTKTQTRRMCKPQPDEVINGIAAFCPNDSKSLIEVINCPYGQPGDQLWVRETWAEVGTMDPGLFVYRANYPDCVSHEYKNIPQIDAIKWKPSIHMSRKASRIQLEITSVRIERLNEISDAESIAEGIEQLGAGWQRYHRDPDAPVGQPFTLNPKLAYRGLWESINGPGSWDANPWVWVIEFKKVPE